MRKRNSVRQLGRTHSHRKAMFNNMVTSLFMHERIVTTRIKGKELKRISDQLITRAKKTLLLTDKEEARKIHNKREVMKVVNNKEVVVKLFTDLAERNKDRKGGYTRIYLLGKRPGDAADMAIVELVERKVEVRSAEVDETKKEKKKKSKEKDKDKDKQKDKKGKEK
jgi:large subunit ribosomal protein L17